MHQDSASKSLTQKQDTVLAQRPTEEADTVQSHDQTQTMYLSLYKNWPPAPFIIINTEPFCYFYQVKPTCILSF